MPPRSPTIVGSAVATIVWSSDARSSTSISAPKIDADARRLRVTLRSAGGSRPRSALDRRLELLRRSEGAPAAASRPAARIPSSRTCRCRRHAFGATSAVASSEGENDHIASERSRDA